MKQTVIAALATKAIQEQAAARVAAEDAIARGTRLVRIGLKVYRVEDVNIREMRPGQNILVTTKNKHGREQHTLFPINTIEPNLQRGCRGVHVNTTKCFDAIATVQRATALSPS